MVEFKDIIGNQEVKDYINKNIENNTIFQAYLFLGTDGIGKKIIAKEFAKKILCNNTNEEACACKSCTCFDSDNHPDFTILNEEGETIKVDEIRQILEKSIEKPILSERKVYIINDAHKMTKEAQNAFLKTLEEPPSFITIILISSNENSILNTIKSRTIKIKFKNIPNDMLKEYLEEKIGYTNLTQTLLKSFGGSIGKAIKLKENSSKYLDIENLLKDLYNKDIIDIMQNAKIMYDKENIYDILDYITVCLYSLSNEERKYLNCIDHVNDCFTKLKANANFDMSIDTLLFNMWEELK